MKSFIVDSFTKEAFKGNPAAVCFPEQELSEEQMLKIAREFGLSETAFVRPANQSYIYTIRFFSPKKEILLCGHATLAAAKVIFNTLDVNEIHFITIENIDLPIQRRNEEIVMEFPIYETVDAKVPLSMFTALGLTETDVKNTAYSPKNKIILLEISDANLLSNLNPDFDALLRSSSDINGVLVTSISNNTEYDYQYRYFWPWAGTNEDPVTGGVQTFLSKYWADRLNKKAMKAFQSSGRTGYMNVELTDEKVFIVSEAIIILEGNLFVS